MLNEFIDWDQKLNGDDQGKRQKLPVDEQGYLDDSRQNPKDRWANSKGFLAFVSLNSKKRRNRKPWNK